MGSAETSAAAVKALYSVMQSIENRLGGGEGVEGLYGSINRSGMHKVLECMRTHCSLDSCSRLVDVGAGLGRPLMHALVDPGISSACGVEIDRIKCDKAAAFLQQTILELRRRGLVGQGMLEAAPEIQCSPIEKVRTLDPCTHAYSFWEGVPPDGKAAFGRLFAASRTLRSVAVVQRAMRGAVTPAEVMAELGFGKLALVESFPVSMSGSGRSFTCYVFNKAAHPARLGLQLPAVEALPAAADSVQTPSQQHEPACAAAEPSQQEAASALGADVADEALSAPSRAEVTGAAGADGLSLRRSLRQRRPATRLQQNEDDSKVESGDEGRAGAAEQQTAADGSRGQRAARRAASSAAAAAAAALASAVGTRSSMRRPAAAPVSARAAGSKLRSSPSKSPSKSRGVQKAPSPTKALQGSASKTKPRNSLLLGTLGALPTIKAALRQQKASAVPASKAGKAAAVGSEEPPARRGLLAGVSEGLRSAKRSVQHALSPITQQQHLKSQ